MRHASKLSHLKIIDIIIVLTLSSMFDINIIYITHPTLIENSRKYILVLLFYEMVLKWLFEHI